MVLTCAFFLKCFCVFFCFDVFCSSGPLQLLKQFAKDVFDRLHIGPMFNTINWVKKQFRLWFMHKEHKQFVLAFVWPVLSAFRCFQGLFSHLLLELHLKASGESSCNLKRSLQTNGTNLRSCCRNSNKHAGGGGGADEPQVGISSGGQTCCGFHFSFRPSANISHSSSTPALFAVLLISLPFFLSFPSSSHPSSSIHSLSSCLLSMGNSSAFLRSAVCPPVYCDFHWDSFKDHSHLKRELAPRLQREINHSRLIQTCIHKCTYEHKEEASNYIYIFYKLTFCLNSLVL